MLERIRTTLEHASHTLTTQHGLTATDTPAAYEQALASGSDPNGAWDTYSEQTWQINNLEMVQEIDALLADLTS